METKTCTKCGEIKELDKFRKLKNGRIKSECRDCENRYSKNKRTEASQFVWDFLSNSNGCVDCGEKDPIVLEFDHVDTGNKSSTITDLSRKGYPTSRIREEIDKCTIKCANCHRRRTAEQFGWYRNINTGG